MHHLRRPVSIAALLTLAAGTSLAVGAPPLTIKASREGRTLSLGGVAVATTQARIAGHRTHEFAGSSTVLMTWEEYGAGKALPTSKYALSLDGGRTVAQVATHGDTVRLRYAQFDPRAGEPLVHPDLAAGAHNEIFLVQFVATPLEEMRTEIRALGGEVLRFMTDNTHIIQMRPETRAKVAALPYVRWVGAYHPAYRLDEMIRAWHGAGDMPTARYSIECLKVGPAQQQALEAFIVAMGGRVEVMTLDQYRMEATLTREQLLAVAQRNEVSFIDPWLGPGGPDMDLIRQMGGPVPLLETAGFKGQGVRGEIFDTGIQPNHQQWNGQIPLTHNTTSLDSHGNACYGVNFATGTGNMQARGLCYEREQGIFCFYNNTSQFGGGPSRLTLNQEATNPAMQFRSVYQTSSVGSPQITSYSTVSAEVDDYLFRADYLSCQSQSNTGNRNSRPQAWAKNIVSVGALALQETVNRDDDTYNPGGSQGPAQDMRVKPDLAHSYENIFTTYSTGTAGYGQFGGTSGATPITAGHFGLLHQMWHQGVWNEQIGSTSVPTGGEASVFASRPQSQTAKALMINGAYRYPINSPITNNMYRARVGWGAADLTKLYNDRAKFLIVDQTNSLTNGQTAEHNVTVGSEPELRITMIFPDPQGTVGAAQQRVNDLTLKVTDPNNVVYWGNVGMVPTTISPATEGANYSTPGGVANTYDTVENVFIQNPISGSWKIEVIASQVVQDGNLATPAVDATYSLVASNVTPGPPPPVVITLPSGVPSLVPPGAPFSVNVSVAPLAQQVVPGSPTAWYRYSGGSFISTPLVSLGGTAYRADFPSPACGNAPQFYFTAQGDLGGTASHPYNAPTGLHATSVGVIGSTTVMSESFESGLPSGWSVTGLWHVSNTCAPGGACDGPTWAYYGQDATCNYNTGVTNTGTLTAAPINLPALPPGGSITLSYCSAKISENFASYDKSTVLANGATVDTAGDSASFTTRNVDLTALAGQSVTLAWKFDTVDSVSNAFRGWHVDNIRITVVGVTCEDPPTGCYANCDQSTAAPILNVADFTCFLTRFAASEGYANCDQSTAPPVLNVADFTCFLQKFAGGCP